MAEIYQLRTREEIEYDQSLESLESRMAEVRKYRELSPPQRNAFRLSGRMDLVEACGQLLEEASEMYRWARQNA